jgi:hypothetical protein
MEQLPLELLAIAASNLICKEYLLMRKFCTTTAKLPPVPELSFASIRLYSNALSSGIKLTMHKIDDEVFAFLLDVYNYMRIRPWKMAWHFTPREDKGF